MSESEESLKVSIPVTPANDVVPIYRVTLVREPTLLESSRTAIRKSSEAAEVLRPLCAELDREQFVVLMLDAQHRPLGMNVISIGSLTASIVHPREVFKAAILSNSAAVIVAHNLCGAPHKLCYVTRRFMCSAARAVVESGDFPDPGPAERFT
jgi:DNA repair protein RadC